MKKNMPPPWWYWKTGKLDSHPVSAKLIQIEVRMTKCFVFFGIQGSGKGTQAELLSSEIGFQHINIGDLLREQVSSKTDLGEKVQSIITRGELVPDELVFEIVTRTLSPTCKGIVFDGFPRTLRQAEYLSTHFNVLQVFFLHLEEDVAIKRISSRRVCQDCGSNYNLISNKPKHDDVCDKCGGSLIIRKDDRAEAISKRLKEFYEQTLILKDYFSNLGILFEIDADTDVETIALCIREKTIELI
jgi:adenylate kinase